MPGKAASPQQIADVVAMREAGYTVATISDRTRLSVSTINRIVATHGSRKGAAANEAIEEARRELRDLLRSKDAIAAEAARFIADDIAQAHLLRERLLSTAEHLTATNLREAALVMRAAAAFSTALKNTSDMVRHSLGYDQKRDEPSDEDLPILIVQELTDDEVQAMRQSAVNDPELDGDEPMVSNS